MQSSSQHQESLTNRTGFSPHRKHTTAIGKSAIACQVFWRIDLGPSSPSSFCLIRFVACRDNSSRAIRISNSTSKYWDLLKQQTGISTCQYQHLHIRVTKFQVYRLIALDVLGLTPETISWAVAHQSWVLWEAPLALQDFAEKIKQIAKKSCAMQGDGVLLVFKIERDDILMEELISLCILWYHVPGQIRPEKWLLTSVYTLTAMLASFQSSNII